MTVDADTAICIGAGQCVLWAPAVFDQNDEDGTVVVLDADPGAEHEEAVRAAVGACPSGAISLTSAP
ncbi:MAG: ferredoxin [Pseudonocardia sp.]